MEDFAAWFTNPASMIVGISSIVKILREKQPAVDGMWLVALWTVIVGVMAGVMGDFANLLLYEPFSEMTTPIGGILYGAVCGASAFLSVNFFDLFFQRKAKAEDNLETVTIEPVVVREKVDIDLVAQEVAAQLKRERKPNNERDNI